MLIKVCGMREEMNVRELINDANPDLMGLIFYPKSPRFVENGQTDKNFFYRLNVPKVGVFVDAHLDYILKKTQQYNLTHLQLHGGEDLDFIQQLKSETSATIIKVFGVDNLIDWELLKAFEKTVDLFLFDTQSGDFGGSGKKFDWSLLKNYPLQTGFILSGGIDADYVQELLQYENLLPFLCGVDINSKFEIQPGIKNIGKVKKFIQELREKSNKGH